MSHYLDVFFIDTSTIATIDTGLKNIAVVKDSGDSQQDGLLWLTSSVEEWLVVFDNADDPSINLNEFIPQCDHDMEVEAAVALLFKSAAQEATVGTEQIAIKIVKVLRYLPLAIVQAGAFISKTQDFDGYLALYTKNQAQLLSEKPAQSHDHYAWTVYTTWQMSFNRLRAAAAMFLQHCSFLHHQGISEEIFSHASKYTFPTNGPSKEELQEPLEFLSYFLGPTGEWDSLLFLHVTNEIQAYSLISFDAKKKLFSIHPLVHAWSRATVSNPERYMSTMGSILGMAISGRPMQDIQLASQILSPHVELAVQMDAEVALVFWHQYVMIFLEARKYKQTEKLLEEVLKKQNQLLGDNHPDTLITMGNLARTYSGLGDYRTAKELDIIVLEKWKQLLGNHHPHTLITMGNLACTYSCLGDHRKAEELNIIVLQNQKQLLGDNHPHTLRTMCTLASVYSDLGEHQKANELKVIVLETQRQLLGDNHPDTLRTMGSLASTYSDLGEHQKAKDLNLHVLEEQKNMLGDNHLHTLRTMANLASVYSDLGEHQKANELNVIVLEKQKQLLSDNHADTLRTMGNLAITYSGLGEHQTAKELNIIVLEKRTQLLGDNHPHTLIVMGNLASTYSDLGEHQKAKELNVIVLEKQKQLLGDNHPHTLRTMHTLAIIQRRLRK
ncbi:TPR-like protein [Mycena venus]|uniref:TPR-like protein n=1 Tax=Mycena venus TaxID=2733690 RepID=A0A8H6XYP0_9AGAR|nr:TPR-like protein [Mycena venus]